MTAKVFVKLSLSADGIFYGLIEMSYMRTTTKISPALLMLPGMMAMPLTLQATDKQETSTLSDVIVSDESEDGRPETPSKTDFATPKTKVAKKEIEETNAVTTSDSIKYESGVFVRQRYIGDQNAPIGMRGSNPYQGGRVMVFMDGMPIWNSLQYTFNGSPRWGLIGPGEIKSVDVLSGPFSAEYSGNAMGGVINFNTLLPQKREIYTEATYMLQPYQFEGTSKNLQGFKTFGSYGDKFGDFSTYFSYNHLENEGQPMTTYNYSNTAGANGGALQAYTSGAGSVSGAYLERNPKAIGSQANQGGYAGQPRISYGDSGVMHSVDDLYKWKGGYSINPQLDALFTAAFENLDVTSVGQTYLHNAAGSPIYGNAAGTTLYNYNGLRVAPTASNFGYSTQNRQTLTLGGGLKGHLFGDWNTDSHVSFFDVLHDQSISSTLNPSDPNNRNAGQITDIDSMGWINISTKFDNQAFFGRKDLSFATGYEYQHSKMFTSQYNSTNYTNTKRDSLALRSGGATDTYGVFGQLSWRFLPDWDATVGTRLERWNVSDGIYISGANNYSPQDRQASTFSPKFSLGYEPGRWKFRYSVGKAYRFPLVGELFDNSNSLRGSVSLANSLLKPEDGTHHNLLGEYDFNNGYIRLNLFHENIRNAIYSSYISNSVLIAQDPVRFGSLTASNFSSTLSSIGEVEVNGIDLTINQDRVFGSDFDVKLDTTILNSKILKNDNDRNFVSKSFPLLPDYRANLLTTYHYGTDWDFSVGTRYQGRMFSQLDNKDLQLPYYAAFTESVYVDLKATYRFNKAGHVSAGIDNINDYQAFFNHPLPQRTFFAQVGYKF